jgi:subtilisin family serine protease
VSWSSVAGATAAAAGPTSTPNDPGFVRHQQWGLVQAGFPNAWCRSTGAGALIVVLDTGVDAAHPDLAGKLVGEARVENGVLTTGPGVADDDSGHGTHVSGIALADTDNALGVAGAAPDARLYAIKVLFTSSPGQPEQGDDTDLAQAIDYATDSVAPSWHGPVVLNISIGAAGDNSGTTMSDTSGDVSAALSHAYSRGLGIAVAAANNGTSPIGGAAVQAGEALSVGALAQNGTVAPYSPTAGVSIFAAGGAAGADQRYVNTGILSTWPHTSAGDYAWMAGTSMAAPHVAAALALLMSTGMSNGDSYARLLQTADSARRMHVDAALGSTAPCGAAARPVTHAAAPPAPAGSHAVSASSTAPPSITVPPATGRTAAMMEPPHARPAVVDLAAPVTGGDAHGASAAGLGMWLLRLTLAMLGCALLWLALPRRLRVLMTRA